MNLLTALRVKRIVNLRFIRVLMRSMLRVRPAPVKPGSRAPLRSRHAAKGSPRYYVRAARLFEELRIAHGDGSFTRRLAQLAKIDVLLLDDWGLQELDQSARNDLLEVIDDRVCSRSTIITSQLPLEHWHAWLQDPTLADAILDRLVHQPHRLSIRPTLDFNAICDGRLVLV